MKKLFNYFLGTLIISSIIIAQENITVEFLVLCDSLPSDSEIYVTGNDKLIGNWQPDFSKLERMHKGKWGRKFNFPEGKMLEYKITRGSWGNEALNDDKTIPSNHKLKLTTDTTIVTRIKFWADQIERNIQGQITGIVKYHSNIKADGISQRKVIIWLPPYYFLESEKRYPVLYMHDGQNLFDPYTSTFNTDWQLDETADSLIRQKLIEDIIIVGIYNTVDRRSEYSENDTGYAYINFIINYLKPFVDKNYRTLTQRENTAVGGSSMGGLISFIITWEFSDVFSKAICMSPAFLYKRFDYVDNVEAYIGDKKNIQIYIDNGGDEIDSTLQPGIDEMLSALKDKRLIVGEDIYWLKEKEAKHNEAAWADRVWRALIFHFGTDEGKKLLTDF